MADLEAVAACWRRGELPDAATVRGATEQLGAAAAGARILLHAAECHPTAARDTLRSHGWEMADALFQIVDHSSSPEEAPAQVRRHACRAAVALLP